MALACGSAAAAAAAPAPWAADEALVGEPRAEEALESEGRGAGEAGWVTAGITTPPPREPRRSMKLTTVARRSIFERMAGRGSVAGATACEKSSRSCAPLIAPRPGEP